MKKIILSLCLVMLGLYTHAQNGLENIIVEKYYVSNAADSAGAADNGSGLLPAGSVTYRLFADMLPGYNFQAVYGVPGHFLTVQTSTAFFNDENFGGTGPGNSATNVRKYAVLLDSYWSVGGSATGKVGVLKTEDNDGSPGNAQNMLQNNDPSAGAPINIGTTTSLSAQDGMIAGSPVAVTFVGITNTGNGDLGVLDGLSQVGGLFTTDNGSVAALGGFVGPTAANRVFIGQFTTTGVFHFELNIQIGTSTGGVQNYVASNPVGNEITAPFLTGTYGAVNMAPTVSITAPANGASFITGANVSIAATAADADGSVDSVSFYIDGVFLSKDLSSPYSASYTAAVGSHCITARAVDNMGAATITACTNITVSANPPPTVAITAPANGSGFVTGSTVNITATATDNTVVDSVAFYIDGVFLSKDLTSPYTATYTAIVGAHCITARATDDQGASAVTSCTNITVANNPPPNVNITSPSNGANFITGATVNVAATATDNGSVTQVEFFVDGLSIGIDASSPYNASFTAGTIGVQCITATATDNLGLTTTTPCTNINSVSSILPYQIVTSSNSCNENDLCLPIAAVDMVNNVIGYDITLHYDAAKVTPTGNITVFGALVTPAWVDAVSNIDAANSLMYISLFFNGSAPANAQFTGVGNLICVEFEKTANYTATDTAFFDIPSLQESYFTGVLSRLVSNGNFSSSVDPIFHGSLNFWSDNSPLAYDQLNPATYLITNIYGNTAACNTPSAVAVQPDLAGNFNYNTANGNNINIDRDITGTTDVQPVINGFDAFLAKQVIVNDITFIPSAYQMIGMDVNIDGFVSAGDVSQINQRTVLLIPEYRQAWNYDSLGNPLGPISKDWLFVDSNRVQTDPAYAISTTYPLNDGTGYSKSHSPIVPFCLPVTNTSACYVNGPETYKGVLLGDVNGNFATVGSGGVFRNSQSEKVIFDLSKAIAGNGYIDIPVSISSDVPVNALDFAMKFNEGNLAFNSIVDHNAYMESMSYFNPGDRRLRFTSYSLQNYEFDKSLISVRFNTNGGTIAEADFNGIAGYINGEKVGVELSSNNDLTASNIDVNVYPNPASTKLNVEVSKNATIELMDEAGRLVMKSDVYGGQKEVINTQALTNGIYTMKVYNDNFVTVKKVVINK